MRDQDVLSFPSDELLAQVDDSELSKFAVICMVFSQDLWCANLIGILTP